MSTIQTIRHRASDLGALPAISPVILALFARYTRWHLSRHFHRIWVSRRGLPRHQGGQPLVVFVNHASWWDPLVCLHLHRNFFGNFRAYAPMDAQALERYPILGRIGMFGVRRGSREGAATFLRAGDAILNSPGHALWITPQGRFADARERPALFEPGLAHLASAGRPATYLPVAIEYLFWTERLPEVLVRFGEPIQGGDFARSASAWNELLQSALTDAQEALALEAQARDPKQFIPLLRGRSGVALVYDAWRRLRARSRGETFHPEHVPCG